MSKKSKQTLNAFVCFIKFSSIAIIKPIKNKFYIKVRRVR